MPNFAETLPGRGNGVLAHVNFGQLFKVENDQAKRFLGRQIVVATIVDAPKQMKPRTMPWGPPPWGRAKGPPGGATPHQHGG